MDLARDDEGVESDAEGVLEGALKGSIAEGVLEGVLKGSDAEGVLEGVLEASDDAVEMLEGSRRKPPSFLSESFIVESFKKINGGSGC